MNERQQEHEVEREETEDERPRRARRKRAPGRASTSASLQRAERPMASGIVLRKASGDDGRDQHAMAVALRRAESSSAQALPDDLRARFEQSTGADLGGVRVHTGPESNEAAAAVGAKAYAVGKDVHFAAGQYDPSSAAGQQLIAHEVFHTLQAPMASGGAGVTLSNTGDSAEVEADRGAEAMVSGQPAVAPSRADGSVVHRKPEEDRSNSYSAQQGLTWSNGTALQEDEIKGWAEHKQKVASVAANYIALTVGFKLTTGADDLVKKLEKEAESEIDRDIALREQEIAWLEKEVANWKKKKGGWFSKIDPAATVKYAEWKARLDKAEAELERVEDSQEARVSRAAQEGAKIVGTINSYASQGSSVAKLIGAETGKLAPDAFESFDKATGRISKVVDAVTIGSKLLDRSAINAFNKNPNLETATAWSRQVTSIFGSLAPLAEGLPMGWDTVVAGMLAMPKIVTEKFLAIMNNYYARLDAEVKDGNGSKLLEPGTSG